MIYDEGKLPQITILIFLFVCVFECQGTAVNFEVQIEGVLKRVYAL